MTIEITYDHGVYEVTGDGATLGHALTYRAGYQIEAAYLEAKHSATMSGDPLLIEMQNLYTDKPPCDICDDSDEYCQWCNPRPIIDNTPLLSECAVIIRRCLGQTTGAQSIVDELRRVEQRLTQEGW